MKVVIVGARGMLGRELGRVFYDLNPYLLGHEALDITSKSGVARVLASLRPDIVINAAAYTDVDGAEENRELANRVNVEAVGYLAEAAQANGALFVHYSTDYVFDGRGKDGYSEDDEPRNPVNAYGESKLLGEQMVRKFTDQFFIIRTSWLFGRYGKNFVETIIRLAEKGGEVRVVNDQHGKPTYAKDLALKTRELITGDNPFGVYHLVNEPATTWYDFAKEIIAQYGKMRGWGQDEYPSVVPVSSDEFPRPAKRPEWSVLLNTKFPPLRPWREALGGYLEERSNTQ